MPLRQQTKVERQERTFHGLNALHDEEESLKRCCLERMPRDALAVCVRVLASAIQAEKQRLAYARVDRSQVSCRSSIEARREVLTFETQVPGICWRRRGI